MRSPSMQPGGTAAFEVWKAAASGDTLLLGKLLRADGASASTLAASGDVRVHEHTALMTAAQNGHAGAVRLLCGVEWVDLRAATEMGRNAIHLATEAGHAEVVTFLAELKLAPRATFATTSSDTAVEETQTVEALPPPDTADPEYSADGSVEDDELTRALSILPEPYAHAVTLQHARWYTHAHTRIRTMLFCRARTTALTRQLPARWDINRRRTSMRQTLETMQPAARAVVLQKLLDAAPAAAAEVPHKGISSSRAFTIGTGSGVHSAQPRPASAENDGLLASVDCAGNNCLHLAAFHGRVDVLQLLLVRGQPRPFDQNNDGLTALHFAAARGELGTLDLLLGVVAKTGTGVGTPERIDRPSSSGMTALHKAVQGGHTAAALKLIASGAKPGSGSGAGTTGFTSFHYAALSGQHATLEALLDATAPDMSAVDIVSSDGRTPLHLAASAGDPETVQCLLARGADVQRTDHRGRAMLHFAAAGGFAALCKHLVEVEGVDPGLRDSDGLTAAHHADEAGRPELGSWLRTLLEAPVPIISFAPLFATRGCESGSAEISSAGLNEVAQMVAAACANYGAFIVTDHGVPEGSNAGVIAAARKFFSLPEDAKHSCYTGRPARGWTPPGENLTASAEFVKQAAPSLQQK